MLCRLIVMSLLCSVCSTGQALKYRVSLMLNTSGELREVLSRALVDRLQAINDVVFVDKDPQFILRVVGTQTRARRGSNLHLILAYSFATVYEGDLGPLFDFTKLPPEAARKVADLVKTLEQYQGSGVVTGSLNGLEEACAKVVAAFDSVVLDSNRKAIREVDRGNRIIGK